MVVVPKQTNLKGDIALAVALIAAEFNVDVDDVPEAVTGIMRAFSAAHYNAGVRDTMVRLANSRAAIANEPVPSSTCDTPVVGPHGRRMRAARASTVPIKRDECATPIVPPPLGVVEDDD